ncbi:MAG TPA: phosphatase PAP2 family protein [Anaerolineae bacterium]|nr:phosphatase PAP2 family protein [Caldilineae bacterium]HID33067.1 phosphatase PAP2 family protein [Anaerolineae bacterium]HIQ11388.1 phosphatase PAP2 family protein [Caldilineales bacterium]
MSSWVTRLEALDQRWSQALRVDDHRLGKAVATVAAHFGDGPLWLALWGAGMLYFAPPIRWRIAAWLLASILAAMVTYTIKFTLKRPRPQEIDGFYSKGYDRHAFPSGHATRMGTLPLFGAWIFPEFAHLFWFVSLICIWARVALGVHYLGDVIAGWLIGAGISLLVIFAMIVMTH